MADNSSSLYAKIWCSIMNDSWFRGLSGNERSVWLQLIIIAKRDGDTGNIYRSKLLDISTEIGLDKRTTRKIIEKFNLDGKIKIIEDTKTFHIQIVNYAHHQYLRGTKTRRDNDTLTQKENEKYFNKIEDELNKGMF